MIKGVVVSVVIALLSSIAVSGQVIISESGGWLESAYLKWEPMEGVDSFNVYISGEGLVDEKLDDQLIRGYGSYFRADALGLKAGSYIITVKPVISEVEGTGSTTSPIVVLPHDRTGFAFSNDRFPGAYNSEGTPRDNTVIIYITENTKNTISLNVTGANANPCVGLQNILDGFKKGQDSRPLIVRLVGQITDPSYLLNGDIVIENKQFQSSFITMEGVGDDAVADGWGIRVKNATNIEIRNIGLMNCNSNEGDNIGLQQENDHIWVHHCDFFYGDAGGDADQAKGDGALDCKRSTYVTFSYNHFWDSGKSNLLGLNEDTTNGLYITYHHNWFDHSDSRHPRVRYYSAHVYNNYYDGNAKYGVGSTLGSSVFVEGNYFRNCKYPMLTSMQGTDVFDESTQMNDYSDQPTFSKEDGGTIKAFDNNISGEQRFVPFGNQSYPNATVDFDAYVASTRDEIIATSVVSAFGGNTYNNFDTNSSIMYAYQPDSPEEAKVKVMQYSGRMYGGDFDWNFNDAVDDALYSVNAALKSALTNYQTEVVSIQGDGSGDGGGNEDSVGTGGDQIHNFTLSGTTSSFFSISGNLSDSKGTVIYDGLTLTQCLKIESSTLISFTTTEEATFTLVFNDNFNGGIKINESSFVATAGIISITIPEATYQITKKDIANLYYMSIDVENSAPTVANAIGDHVAQVGFLETTIDLTGVFEDVDEDALTLSAASDDLSVATVSLTKNMLTITEVGVGTTHITLTADDGNDGMVSDSFIFHINAPPIVENAIPDQIEPRGFGSLTLDLTTTFSDINEDDLRLSALSDNMAIVTVAVSGKVLTIAEIDLGTTMITITANDGNGQEVSDTFEMTVIDEVAGSPKGLKSEIRVFPNPVFATMSVESEDVVIEHVEIHNLLGARVKSFENNFQAIDLSLLRTGTYIVTIISRQDSFRKTMIKK